MLNKMERMMMEQMLADINTVAEMLGDDNTYHSGIIDCQIHLLKKLLGVLN